MGSQMKNNKTLAPKRGFTLIEVIITIVIIGIAATVSLTYFGTALTESGSFRGRITQTQSVENVMEQITCDYIQAVNNDTNQSYQTVLTTLQGNDYSQPAVNGALPVVVTMERVRFSGANLVAAGGNDSDILLRVTVASGGVELVNLLSRSRTQNNSSVAY